MKTKVQQEWFSFEDAAKHTGFSEKSIRNAAALGRFPVRRVEITAGSKSVRIKRTDLDAWLESSPLQDCLNPQPGGNAQ